MISFGFELKVGSRYGILALVNICSSSIEDNFLKYTQIGEIDVDIFIRTGGDMRLSNFLLPNIGYSELFFTEKLWPEFSANNFVDILEEFDQRQRRFGK